MAAHLTEKSTFHRKNRTRKWPSIFYTVSKHPPTPRKKALESADFSHSSLGWNSAQILSRITKMPRKYPTVITFPARVQLFKLNN
jgi:hypothetical protein